MTDNAESRPTADGERLRIARIYFRHRTETRRPGLIGWLFPTSTPRVLAERALEAGALHASLTLGYLGFVKGARRVAQEQADTSSAALPSCLEVVASVETMAAFLRANTHDLADTTVVLLDGVVFRTVASAP